jgi:hypothetical protein
VRASQLAEAWCSNGSLHAITDGGYYTNQLIGVSSGEVSP